MAKQTFQYRTEWSDQSPTSPQTWGRLPHAVILPDGERITISDEPQHALPAYQLVTRTGYAQIHANVRVRVTPWGSTGGRHGRAGAMMEILAPKNSRFLFANYCSFCGRQTGEQELPGKRYDERAPEIAHPECQAEDDEQIRFTREEYEKGKRQEEEYWHGIETD